MKNMALLLSVTFVLLVSACVQLPFGREQVGAGPGTAEIKNSDVTVQVLAYPAEVRGGSDISVKWDTTNMQENDPLSDVNINAYDTCLFSGTETTKHFDKLQPNRTQTWDWSWTSQTTPFERDCEIKFKTNWSGTAHVSQQISVLTDSEYYAREQAGTLSALSGTSTASSNPVSISLRFSDPMPWQTGSTVYMHIDVSNIGGGLIDKMPKGSIQITVPNNLVGSCDGYLGAGSSCTGTRTYPCSSYTTKSECDAAFCSSFVTGHCTPVSCPKTHSECDTEPGCDWIEEVMCNVVPCTSLTTSQCGSVPGCQISSSSNTLVLDRDLNFVSGRAPSLTCTFTTAADEPISTGVLNMSANYKYELDNSFTVKVKTK